MRAQFGQRNRLRRQRRGVQFDLESREQIGRRGAALDQERAGSATRPLTTSICPGTVP